MANGKANSIKVLAIDGGGIRGIIPALILSEIQKQLSKELWQCFDLISGTSTGGIIALGIGTACNNGKPYAPDQLVDLYVRNGPQIFAKNWLTGVRELFAPKYSPASLEYTLAKFFLSTEFSTALTPLLVSSYDLQTQRPFFFKSHKIAAYPNYNWRVVDIARATSAAPTFFPPLHLVRGPEDYALVDGGVFVNNPAMAAYVEARALYPDAEKIVVVSVGTGDRQDNITYATAKGWGLLGWARQIVPVLMDSVSEAVDYELGVLPECSYHRLQVLDLTAASSHMDNVSPENLSSLQTIARNYISSHSTDINKACAEVKTGRGSNMPGIGRRTAKATQA